MTSFLWICGVFSFAFGAGWLLPMTQERCKVAQRRWSERASGWELLQAFKVVLDTGWILCLWVSAASRGWIRPEEPQVFEHLYRVWGIQQGIRISCYLFLVCSLSFVLCITFILLSRHGQ
jgi:hypothetical protein